MQPSPTRLPRIRPDIVSNSWASVDCVRLAYRRDVTTNFVVSRCVTKGSLRSPLPSALQRDRQNPGLPTTVKHRRVRYCDSGGGAWF